MNLKYVLFTKCKYYFIKITVQISKSKRIFKATIFFTSTSKIMQNLTVLMDPMEEGYFSSRGGNMILNRFCIDEDAAFELSGINYFKTSSHKNCAKNCGLKHQVKRKLKYRHSDFLEGVSLSMSILYKRRLKGRDYSSLQQTIVFS